MNNQRRPILKKFTLIPLWMWPGTIVEYGGYILAIYLMYRLRIIIYPHCAALVAWLNG